MKSASSLQLPGETVSCRVASCFLDALEARVVEEVRRRLKEHLADLLEDELLGLFERHRRLRREVALVDCNGKSNIPAFQRVLNAFSIPYRVLHDADPGNPAEQANNQKILGLLPLGAAQLHMVMPDLEG